MASLWETFLFLGKYYLRGFPVAFCRTLPYELKMGFVIMLKRNTHTNIHARDGITTRDLCDAMQ